MLCFTVMMCVAGFQAPDLSLDLIKVEPISLESWPDKPRTTTRYFARNAHVICDRLGTSTE